VSCDDFICFYFLVLKKLAISLIINAAVLLFPAFGFADATDCGIMLKLQQ